MTPQQPMNIQNIQSRCSQPIEKKEVYEKFQQGGYHYGKTFQVIHQLYMGENEALADLI
jgi:polyketide synthase PksN